jgi:hypothetical protein
LQRTRRPRLPSLRKLHEVSVSTLASENYGILTISSR